MTLRLTIPHKKAKDKNFENILLEKWKQLLEKCKGKNVVKMDFITDEYVIIFWERFLLKDINWSIEIHLKQKLYEASLPILSKYLEQLWVKHKNFYIKDLKTKWWSCSWINNISINLKLIHFNLEILEYVIIHEICHIREKNHSRNFWNLVWKHCSNYKELRKELRKVRI